MAIDMAGELICLLANPRKSAQRIPKIVIVLICISIAAASIRAQNAVQEARPSLIVMIAVDALGADQMKRYRTLFTGGFRRLYDTGASFNSAMVDHAISISHPGHVTLSTGMFPSHHGIVDAAFYEQHGDQWQFTDALTDPSEHIVGVPNARGVSPKKILVSALPEWITAADSKARTVAIGAGQYSALLHACRGRGDVYWYLGDVGRFVTSSYYRQDYPEWIERFNKEKLPEYINSSLVWDNTVPESARHLARRDDAAYEGDHTHVTFPHSLARDSSPQRLNDAKARNWWFAGTPMLDEATLALAEDAVCARELGRRGSTDYLSIVLSEVDDIGHFYGSFSQEQLDNLLRLDRELGQFFDFLDEKVGKDRYVVAVSADHSMMDIPEALVEQGQSGRRITEMDLKPLLDEVRATMVTTKGTREQIGLRVTELLRHYDFVAAAMTSRELMSSAPSDEFLALTRNSFRPDRVPRFPLFDLKDGKSPVGEAGVVARLKRGVIVDVDPATHGSPYEYDRHVPLFFMGRRIEPTSSNAPARTVDVAPTLAKLGRITVPKGLDGHALPVPMRAVSPTTSRRDTPASSQ
jgi:predicted AlkP superfamily pyrophosphatase or phosphodiesterase